MESSTEGIGNKGFKLQEIPHLFHWKGEFDEIRSALYALETPKERTDILLNGFLQSSNIINMYMVFEALEDVSSRLEFDENHVSKLVEFKNKNEFGHVHPYFLCHLDLLRYKYPYFLDMLLRCEDLVSSVMSEKIESRDCVSATKILNQESTFSFSLPSALCDIGNYPVIEIHVKGGLGNVFDIQLKSDVLKAKNIHIIFKIIAIHNKKYDISEYMHFQSWCGKPSYCMDPGGAQYMWGDICLGRGVCGNGTDCEDVLVKLIAFVDVTKHAEDHFQSLIQRNKD